MIKFEKQKNQKIFEVLLIMKSIYFLMALVAILSSVKIKEIDNPIAITFMAIIILIFMIVYFTWIIYYQKISLNRSKTVENIIEIAVLLFIFTFVITLTGINDSPYKFMCVFIILISVIQFEEKHSILIAMILSVELLIIDYVSSASKSNFSVYFERDLVLIASLLVTAFILSMYVKIERNHSNVLKNLVNLDELTGLYNHRYFQERLSEFIEEASIKNKKLSLLFMDIDYFKNYNDINGHQMGDCVLKEIGEILKNSVREGDVVARYGGEEFIAILPDSDEKVATEIGERIRLAVEEKSFHGQESQPNKKVTMSVGISSYPKNGMTKYQLINVADDALYRAKFFDRNRVELYYSVLDEISSGLFINDEIKKSLKAFISMINKKDMYTYGHTERVVIYCKWFGEYIGLSEKEQVDLKVSAYLHDIGKVEIPEEILNKKTRLTEEEFNRIKEHPKISSDLISNMKPFEMYANIVKHHHERYDGRGYPDGLRGEEIPYLSRMLSIADSFDAMTSHRPYNKRKSHEEGKEELLNNAGTQFDPVLVVKFVDMLNDNRFEIR